MRTHSSKASAIPNWKKVPTNLMLRLFVSLQCFWCCDQSVRFCWQQTELISRALVYQSFVAILRMFVLLNLGGIQIKDLNIWFWSGGKHSSEWKSAEVVWYWGVSTESQGCTISFLSVFYVWRIPASLRNHTTN